MCVVLLSANSRFVLLSLVLHQNRCKGTINLSRTSVSFVSDDQIEARYVAVLLRIL